MVIELKRGEVADVILNNLYEHTAMQSVFGINTVALVNGQPRLLNLKELLEAFIRHRREVVTRRSIHDLRESRNRAHVLEGLAVALDNIDEMIALIKASKDPAEAKAKMMARAWKAVLVTQMLERSDVNLTRPGGWIWRSALPKKATSFPMSRRRRFSICGCTGSRAWSRRNCVRSMPKS